jgi:hypothetical protein
MFTPFRRLIVRSAACAALILLTASHAGAAMSPDFRGARPGVWTMDYDAAMARAQAEGRRVIVFFTGALWCPHCIAQDTQAFSKPEWQQYVDDQGLLLVCLDNPKRDGSRFDGTGKPIVLLEDPAYLAAVLAREGHAITREEIEATFATNALLQVQYTLPEYVRVGYPTCILVRPDGDRMGRFSSLATTVTLDQVLRRMEQILQYSDPDDDRDGSLPYAKPLATPAALDLPVRAGAFHLGETDTADCYAFTVTTNSAWRFAVGRDAGWTNDAAIRLEILNAASNVVLSQTGQLATGIALDFAPQNAGIYVLKVRTDAAITQAVGYTLDYSTLTLQAYAWFTATAVSVSEAAAAATVSVSVRELVPQASIRVRYSVEQPATQTFGIAWPGEDFTPPSAGGILEWTGTSRLPKTFTIPLLHDAIWEGPETFVVTLEALEGCEILNESARATVTINENSTRKAGSLGITHWGPATNAIPSSTTRLPATENQKMTLWLSRSAGSDGVVTAKMSMVQGTVAVPTNEYTLSGGTAVWKHGETVQKKVEITFAERPGYNADRVLLVKLAASGGAAATYGKSQATVAVQDKLVTQSLAEYLLEHPAPALRAVSGTWFYSAAAPGLRCAPPLANGSAVLQATVTGPGLLSFDWELAGAAIGDGSSLACQVGTTTRGSLTGASPSGAASVAVPAGSQTVKWTLRRGASAAEAYAVLRNLVWTPLPKATPGTPTPGQSLMERNFAGLTWTVPGTCSFCRVSTGNSAAVLAALPGTFTDSVDPSLLEARIDAAQGRPLYWRIDTVAHDSFGGEVVNAGAVASFSVLPEGSPEFFAGDAPTNHLGAVAADLGVACSFGPFVVQSGLAGTIGCTVDSGLPSGLSLSLSSNQVTLAGVPKATGTFQVVLRSSVRLPAGTTAPGATATLTVHVAALPAGLVGTYDGGVDSDTYGTGLATLSVTAAGSLSGKLTIRARAHAFSGFFARKVIVDEETRFVYEGVARYGFGLSAVNIPLNINITPDGRTECELSAGTGVNETLFLVRNRWRDAGMAAVLNRLNGYYTMALPWSGGTAPSLGGSGYLTLTVGAGGSTRIAATLADGSTFSQSATLLFMPDADAEPTDGRALLWICSATTTQKGFCGILEVVPGTNAPANNVVIIAPDGAGALRWWNYDPRSVPGYNPVFDGGTPANELGFINEVDAVGGFYSPTASLRSYYTNQVLYIDDMMMPPDRVFTYSTTDFGGLYKITETSLEEAPVTCYEAGQPLAITVTDSGLTLNRPGDLAYLGKDDDGMPLYNYDTALNPTALRLAFTRATGIFSGGFSIYYDYESAMDWTADGGLGKASFTHTAVPVTYKGILTPNRIDGNPYAGQGFFLVPNKSVYENDDGKQFSYNLNHSCLLTLGEE